MYNNILIPVMLGDSRDTQSAFKAAQALADAGAQITLLHVIETVPVYVSEYFPPDFITTARDTVQTALDAMVATLPGSRAAIAEGKAGPRICRWAEENDCDCIVIASHKPVMSDFFLGSVAHHVVGHAGCAIHVVR
ncbi:universal stress protein [Sulfitobacter sp. 20_GPM-1509m]|uniref:universal stress protein n=1 Tax=Sulfitobacter sp. 20_GPM-1509m TaxID=1380367 RepID=UPI00048CD4E1|nr:universal stress protein [Sulfitobacter sp. 20_GPM-1509m]